MIFELQSSFPHLYGGICIAYVGHPYSYAVLGGEKENRDNKGNNFIFIYKKA